MHTLEKTMQRASPLGAQADCCTVFLFPAICVKPKILTLEKTGQAASPQSCIIRAAINAIVMAG